MKKSLKKMLLLVVTMLGYVNATAQNFYWEGLQFEVMSESPATARLHKVQRCLSSFVIPEIVDNEEMQYAVIAIGEEAFRYLDCISEVNLGRVEVIEDGYVVHYSDNGSNSYYGGFAYAANLRQVHFGNLRKVGDYAFYGCQGLSVIDLKKVENLGKEAFLDCTSLKEVKMGEKMQSIGKQCFMNCDSISSIKMVCNLPPLCSPDAFANKVYETAVLQVPEGTKETYMKTEGWNKFVHIEEMETTAVSDVWKDASDNVRLMKNGKSLILEGVPQNTVVKIFDMRGDLLNSKMASREPLSFQLPKRGVYFVSVGLHSFKVAL